MKTFKNLIIIGTSHIAIQSVKEVEDTIENQKPDIIAIELDKKRFFALTHKAQKPTLIKIRSIGIKGWLLNLIASYIQNKLGKQVGVIPGSEMKIAIDIAKKLKIPIALIDQDIEITINKLSKELTLKEKFKFMVDIFASLILKRDKIKIDLTKVPEEKLIKKLIKKLKERYPTLYKILIKERNKYMAQNLYTLMSQNDNKKIVAIVGAGHEPDIIQLVKKLPNEKN